MLDSITKDLDVDAVMTSTTKEANEPIRLKTNFVLGFPDETQEDVQKMLDLVDLRERTTGYRCQVFIFAPWPGTPLFQKAREKHLRSPQTLEEWSKVKLGNADYLTFHPAAYRRFIQAVFYMNLFLHKKPSIPAGKLSGFSWIIVKSILLWATFSARVRLRYRFFRFLFFWNFLHRFLFHICEDVYYDLFSREER